MPHQNKINENFLPLQINLHQCYPTQKCRIPFKTQTNGQIDMSVCVLVRCVCQWRPSYGWTKRDAS